MLERVHTVRAGTRDDADGIVALIGRVFEEYRWIYDPPTEVADLYTFDKHYAPPRGAFWVVTDAGRIVGSIGVERVDATSAELHRLYLDSDRRGQGLGEALVQRVVDWCREQGIGRLVLWSDTRFEHAHRLYRRLGFEQDGVRTLVGDVNDSREYGFARDL
jgi:GNAT superfamily N-acetyltransferase